MCVCVCVCVCVCMCVCVYREREGEMRTLYSVSQAEMLVGRGVRLT